MPSSLAQIKPSGGRLWDTAAMEQRRDKLTALYIDAVLNGMPGFEPSRCLEALLDVGISRITAWSRRRKCGADRRLSQCHRRITSPRTPGNTLCYGGIRACNDLLLELHPTRPIHRFARPKPPRSGRGKSVTLSTLGLSPARIQGERLLYCS